MLASCLTRNIVVLSGDVILTWRRHSYPATVWRPEMSPVLFPAWLLELEWQQVVLPPVSLQPVSFPRVFLLASHRLPAYHHPQLVSFPSLVLLRREPLPDLPERSRPYLLWWEALFRRPLLHLGRPPSSRRVPRPGFLQQAWTRLDRPQPEPLLPPLEPLEAGRE